MRSVTLAGNAGLIYPSRADLAFRIGDAHLVERAFLEGECGEGTCGGDPEPDTKEDKPHKRKHAVTVWSSPSRWRHPSL